eukprot:4542212-Amphidinium_carterae.1
MAALVMPVKTNIRELAQLASVVLDPWRIPLVVPPASSSALRATMDSGGKHQSVLHSCWQSPACTSCCRTQRGLKDGDDSDSSECKNIEQH